MTKIVDTSGNELFSKYDFDSLTFEERFTFLDKVIEKRANHLLSLIDPKHPASATVINKRLNLPLECQNELDELKEETGLSSEDRDQRLEQIEHKFFGNL